MPGNHNLHCPLWACTVEPLTRGNRMSTPVTIMLLLKRVDCIDGVASYLETLITGLREVGGAVATCVEIG